MKCSACGAHLAPGVPHCTFCGVITPFGLQQQELERQHAAHAQALHLHREHELMRSKQDEATRALKRSADATLYWGLGGLVLCCFFVPSVVAVVLGLRARAMARRYNLVIPLNATLGLALGAVGVLGGISLVSIGVIEDRKKESALAEIEAKLADKADRVTLDQPTACLLAKRSLLKGEFGGSDSLDDFECDGKLTVAGDRADLEDVRFKRSSARHTLRACLKRGARWSVSTWVLAGTCSEAEAGIAPTTGASVGAAPSSAPAPSGS